MLEGNMAQIDIILHQNVRKPLALISNNAFVGDDGKLMLDANKKPLPTTGFSGWKAEIAGVGYTVENGKIVTHVFGPASQGDTATSGHWICYGPEEVKQPLPKPLSLVN